MKIIIKGTGPYFELFQNPDEGDCLAQKAITSNLQVLADGQDITKQKGKYTKVDYIEQRFNHENILYCIGRDQDYELEYELPISKDEFDPKKLQLVKDDYSMNILPWYIITDYIIYDGKEYELSNWEDYVDLEATRGSIELHRISGKWYDI